MNSIPETASVKYSLSKQGPGYRLSPHFTLIEFASKDGADEVLVSLDLVKALERLRTWAGGPIMITSGYRSEQHNNAIGGATNSRHRFGLAADVYSMNKTPDEIADWAEEQGFGGVGRYDNFTHLDVFSENRRWDRRT